jgi:hypothetical protein
MGLTATLGILLCPNCKSMTQYSGMDYVPIYETKCKNCRKEWQIINHPDGRTEAKPKTIN